MLGTATVERLNFENPRPQKALLSSFFSVSYLPAKAHNHRLSLCLTPVHSPATHPVGRLHFVFSFRARKTQFRILCFERPNIVQLRLVWVAEFDFFPLMFAIECQKFLPKYIESWRGLPGAS
jgi:hypothetical protein